MTWRHMIGEVFLTFILYACIGLLQPRQLITLAGELQAGEVTQTLKAGR